MPNKFVVKHYFLWCCLLIPIAVANRPTVSRLVHGLAGRQASGPPPPSNLAAVWASIYHTIHTLTLTLTVNLTLISSYLTNKHQYAQPNMSANWMTSRLHDQSAARCKNCQPASLRTNRPTVSWLATSLKNTRITGSELGTHYERKCYCQ